MQPQSDKPSFPKMSGDLEDGASAAPKGVFGKALFKTFIQPSLDQVAWKARQFGPKQMAFNMLSSTPFGQKLIDLKGNYDFAKDPNHEGFDNNDVNAKGNNTPGNGANGNPYMNSELKAIVETLQTNLSTMTAELKAIKRNIENLQRTNATGTTEQTGTKTKVTELVELFRSFFNKDKFDTKENNLGKEDKFDDKPIEKEKKNWLMDIIGFIAKFRLAFMGGLASLRVALTGGFARITGAVTRMFQAIKIPKIPGMGKLGGLMTRLTKITADIGKLLGPLGKVIPRILKVVGKFSGITTVIMVAIDGIVGFFKGWGDTDGPIYKKFAGAFDGALQGIVKGILEIPKILLQVLKFIGTSIVDMLGFKKLAESMRAFNLGDWWDRTIGGFVEKFDIAQSMVTIGERVVDIFLGICEFIVKKLTGVTINLKGPQETNSQNADNQSNLLGQIMRGALSVTPGGAAIAAVTGINAAPSSGADGAAAAVSDGGARVRAGVGATAETGGGAGRPALGIRNNNPGNIEYNRRNDWVGQRGPGEGGRFSAFDSTENGIRAIGRLLQSYDRQGVNTLTGIVNKWAPASDGNNTAAYVATLQRYTGFSANQRIDLQDPATLQRLVRGIIAQENGGSSARISDAQIQEGVRRALGGRSVADANPGAGQAARVDNNTSALQRTGAMAAAALIPALPVSARPIITNMISNNNQNNTIAPTRPRASSPDTSPTGPRS